jgi:molybdopterin-guanine dinucleotide biosynthesis protein A
MRNHATARGIPAVVLAGGRPKPEWQAMGVTNRALIEIEGRTMLARVATALRAASAVGSITVLGDVPDSLEYDRLPDQGGFVENIFAGLAAAEGDCALLCTSDTPFLTGEAVQDFLARGAEIDADMVYPYVPVEKCYACFPGIRRTAVTLREGKFTGGNMILVRPAFMLAQRARLAQAYAARKSPLRLALMLGIGTTLRLAVNMTVRPGLLNVPELEAAVSHLLGGTARGLLSDYPEIATDIDRPADLRALGL